MRYRWPLDHLGCLFPRATKLSLAWCGSRLDLHRNIPQAVITGDVLWQKTWWKSWVDIPIDAQSVPTVTFPENVTTETLNGWRNTNTFHLNCAVLIRRDASGVIISVHLSSHWYQCFTSCAIKYSPCQVPDPAFRQGACHPGFLQDLSFLFLPSGRNPEVSQLLPYLVLLVLLKLCQNSSDWFLHSSIAVLRARLTSETFSGSRSGRRHAVLRLWPRRGEGRGYIDDNDRAKVVLLRCEWFWFFSTVYFVRKCNFWKKNAKTRVWMCCMWIYKLWAHFEPICPRGYCYVPVCSARFWTLKLHKWAHFVWGFRFTSVYTDLQKQSSLKMWFWLQRKVHPGLYISCRLTQTWNRLCSTVVGSRICPWGFMLTLPKTSNGKKCQLILGVVFTCPFPWRGYLGNCWCELIFRTKSSICACLNSWIPFWKWNRAAALILAQCFSVWLTSRHGGLFVAVVTRSSTRAWLRIPRAANSLWIHYGTALSKLNLSSWCALCLIWQLKPTTVHQAKWHCSREQDKNSRFGDLLTPKTLCIKSCCSDCHWNYLAFAQTFPKPKLQTKITSVKFLVSLVFGLQHRKGLAPWLATEFFTLDWMRVTIHTEIIA